jgi:hypothetical protein
MAKKIKLELTEPQFICLIDVIDTVSALGGTGREFTIEQNKNVLLLDRMLKKNGYKRTHT